MTSAPSTLAVDWSYGEIYKHATPYWSLATGKGSPSATTSFRHEYDIDDFKYGDADGKKRRYVGERGMALGYMTNSVKLTKFMRHELGLKLLGVDCSKPGAVEGRADRIRGVQSDFVELCARYSKLYQEQVGDLHAVKLERGMVDGEFALRWGFGVAIVSLDFMELKRKWRADEAAEQAAKQAPVVAPVTPATPLAVVVGVQLPAAPSPAPAPAPAPEPEPEPEPAPRSPSVVNIDEEEEDEEPEDDAVLQAAADYKAAEDAAAAAAAAEEQDSEEVLNHRIFGNDDDDDEAEDEEEDEQKGEGDGPGRPVTFYDDKRFPIPGIPQTYDHAESEDAAVDAAHEAEPERVRPRKPPAPRPIKREAPAAAPAPAPAPAAAPAAKKQRAAIDTTNDHKEFFTDDGWRALGVDILTKYQAAKAAYKTNQYDAENTPLLNAQAPLYHIKTQRRADGKSAGQQDTDVHFAPHTTLHKILKKTKLRSVPDIKRAFGLP